MKRKGIMAEGASLLWRRQRVLWWVFAVNLALGVLAAAPVRSQLRILDSSRAAADSIYHELNLFRLDEAVSRPEGLSSAFYNGSVLLAFVFFAFLIFAMGGVLESLSLDRTLRFGEFVRASAEYFWRMARLLVVLGVLLVPVLAAHAGIQPLADWMETHYDAERLNFFVPFGLHVLLGLAALAIRVWIDVAQVDLVTQDEAAVRRSLRRAWQLLRGNFGRVYGAVIAIQLCLLIATFVLLAIWERLPHEAIRGTVVIGELIVVLWLGCRFWQKAVECAWYQERMILDRASVEVVVGEVPAFEAGRSE